MQRPIRGAVWVAWIATACLAGCGRLGSSPALKGTPAKPINLPLLNGGRMDLASHRDKDIVIVDFWATWCGPCVREMPLLAKIAKDYEGKGVVFYAVHEGDDQKAIRSYLKDANLNVQVAVDGTGVAGKDYGVSSIPFLLIIDKKGAIRAVHGGYDPNIQSVLKRELDSLLAG